MLMQKLIDDDTSLSDMIDGFFSYKVNKYINKADNAFKRMRGEVVCESDIIMADLLEPQYFINSLSDKIMARHSYLTQPFKQTYAIKEIKNALTERLSFGGADYSKITNLPDDLAF
jgi:inhibitor of KinA sporulation pathway (predicted exonuclease)